jgi:hypothetical protein
VKRRRAGPIQWEEFFSILYRDHAFEAFDDFCDFLVPNQAINLPLLDAPKENELASTRSSTWVLTPV